MPSPLVLKASLVLKNFGSRTGAFFCVALVALTLLFAASAQGQTLTTTALPEFYPRTLDLQLRRIAESSAAEVEPLREICKSLLNDINAIVFHIEHHPKEPYPYWERFEESARTLEALQQSWTIGTSVCQPYIPSVAALDEVVLALQRRIFIWRALFQAKAAEASPITTLYGKSFVDIDRLKERTIAVRQYFTRSGARFPANPQTRQTWCDYFETQSWLTTLEASGQPAVNSVRLVAYNAPALPVETLPVEILKALSERANTTIHRLDSPAFTNEQRAFLNHPTVNDWKEELQRWSADIVTPIHVLQLVEQYEETGGMTDMRALALSIDQLITSKTAEYRQLGNSVRRQYGMPNVRIFLSNALLNNHLPPAISETAAFRDVIQSQPVVGRRQSETELAVSFVPHPTRVLIALDIGVALETISRTDAFATQLFSTGETMVVARKQIELTERGFLAQPSEASIVNHRMRLVRMDTDFDGVPIMQRLVRGIVRNQYEERYQDANTEAQRRILRQVRSQIDRETEQRLQPINERIRLLAQHAAEEFDLRVEQGDSRTDENWLLTAWGVRNRGTLSGSTPAPATLPGSFADLKVHESLPNMLLGKLELEGKSGTVMDFKEMLAEKFRQPGLAESAENDHVELMFAEYNPVVVRFVDGRAELAISIAALRLANRTHRDFQVIVRYKPGYDLEGRLVLERDDTISVINVPSVGNQVVMRAVFGKIFPLNRPFPLVPNVLESDPQFYYLTTGHSRIEKGWFAIALVEKPE